MSPHNHGEDNGNRMDYDYRERRGVFHHHGRNYQGQVLAMRNPTQRSKSAANKNQKYRKQLRQKKHNRQQWVLRNVPEHKLYKRKSKPSARHTSAMQD